MRITITLGLGCLALAGQGFADVLVVNPSGTGDHLQIQDAVLAASDGDTILVESGTYQPVVVTHKGLAIVADEGAIVHILGGVHVQDTLVFHEVVLAGLDIRGLHDTLGSARVALTLSTTRGAVRIEDCALTAADGVGYTLIELGAHAARLDFALDVSFVGCTFKGGAGGMSFSGFAVNRGGDALHAESSTVALHDCLVEGGDGGPGDFLGCDYGGNAGHGAWIDDTVIFASGSTFRGGDGGGDGFLACQAGGHGVFLIAAGSEGHFLDDVMQGGLGACGALDGQPIVTTGGATANFIPGSAHRLTSPTPARELEIVSLVFEGLPGESAYVLFSVAPDTTLFLPLNGVLLLQLPLAQGRRFMGTIPATGTLVKSLMLPALPPGVEASTLYLQSMFQSPMGSVWLGSPSSLVLLDESF